MTFTRGFTVQFDQDVSEAAAICDVSELDADHRRVFDAAVAAVEATRGEGRQFGAVVSMVGWANLDGGNAAGAIGLNLTITRLPWHVEVNPYRIESDGLSRV